MVLVQFGTTVLFVEVWDQNFELESKFPLVTAIFVVARGEMCLLKTSRQNSVGELQGHTLI
jgi:hypothetical protein